MKLYDISWPISPAMTAYKDKKTVQFDRVKNFENDAVRESIITLGSHSGTHVDAPSHFMQDGQTIEHMNLRMLIGDCIVLDLTAVEGGIGRDHLEDADIQAGDIILLKTKNSVFDATAPFNPNFIYLAESGAHYLVERNIRAVGIDYLGIERGQLAHETHVQLFNAGITILEGLRLADVPAGKYFLCCLPLKIQGLEAAPARAVLISQLV
jgi:arylformamidase